MAANVNPLGAPGTAATPAGGAASEGGIAPEIVRQLANELIELADLGVPVEPAWLQVRLRKVLDIALPDNSGPGAIWVRPRQACRIAGIGNTKLYDLLSRNLVESRRVDNIRLISVASLRKIGRPTY